MGYFLGVDLGTTYTAAGVHDGRAATMAGIGSSSPLVPSAVWMDGDGRALIGRPALQRGTAEPGRLSREFKRRVGDPSPIILGGTPYSAEHLMAQLLSWVIEQVSATEGESPDGIAVTHPANWGGYKLELLDQCLQIAGATGAVTAPEPVAAAVHYALERAVADDEVVAVYDLGGGTFDAAVLARDAGGFELVAPAEGIERLGGIDFDAAVFAFVHEHLGPALDASDRNDPDWVSSINALRSECTAAKEALSTDSDAVIDATLPTGRETVTITRAEFEQRLRPRILDTLAALRRALQSAKVMPSELSAVLLVGGSSRIPLVAELVSNDLGVPVALDPDPKHAIALGAAHIAHRAGARPPAREDGRDALRLAPHVPTSLADRPVGSEPDDVDLHSLSQEVIQAAVDADRADLAERLEESTRHVRARRTRIVVGGDFKAGKSSLVNALVGHDICPVDADFSTAVPTVVVHSETPFARVQMDTDGDTVEEEVALEEVPDHVAWSALGHERPRVLAATIGADVPWMADRVELVDLPGAGGLDSPAGARAAAEISAADITVFASGAGQELTAPELELLDAASDTCPDVIYALTKIDYYLEWRKIRDLDTGHLGQAELEIPIVPVSAALCRLARDLGDDSFRADGGIDVLLDEIRRASDAVQRDVTRRFLHDLRARVAQLRSGVMAEIEALDPARAAQVVADLEERIERLIDMRQVTSRWYRTLEDGTAALRRDWAQELESQVAKAAAHAHELIEQGDPGENWDEFEAAVGRSASWATARAVEFLEQRADTLRQEVTAGLDLAADDALSVAGATSSPWMGALRLDRESMLDDMPDEGLGMTALTSGWTLADPVVAVIGAAGLASGLGIAIYAAGAVGAVLVGGKSVLRKRARAVSARRAQARDLVDDYFGKVTDRVSRELDAATDRFFREVRHHAFERIDEMERTLSDAAHAAGQQSNDAEAREARGDSLRSRLAKLTDLEERLQILERAHSSRAPAGHGASSRA